MATRPTPPPEPPPAPSAAIGGLRPRRPMPLGADDPPDLDIAPPPLGWWLLPVYLGTAIFCFLAWIPLSAALWLFGRWSAQLLGLA